MKYDLLKILSFCIICTLNCNINKEPTEEKVPTLYINENPDIAFIYEIVKNYPVNDAISFSKFAYEVFLTESEFEPTAKNGTMFGIIQMTNKTRKHLNCQKTTDLSEQIHQAMKFWCNSPHLNKIKSGADLHVITMSPYKFKFKWPLKSHLKTLDLNKDGFLTDGDIRKYHYKKLKELRL